MVGRGHVGVLPEHSSCRLCHDAIRHERIAKPDLRDPVEIIGDFPEVEAKIRRICSILDDARLVDDIELHPLSEFFPDPGEVHSARILPRTFIFGKNRTKFFFHPRIQRLIEEFQPRVHKMHRLNDAHLCLVTEKLITGGQGIFDLPAIRDQDQPGDGEHDQEQDEQQMCTKTAIPPAAVIRHGSPPSAFLRVNRMAVPDSGCPGTRSSTRIRPPYLSMSIRQI